MRILAHRAVEELHLAAMSLQLLQQQNLMHVVARQPVRRGDQDQCPPSGLMRQAGMVEERRVSGSS
jgi:hypothetical protein